eukprot:TRINITY_DN20608_c0_g1_i1.p1 TRINITY_DN20608_c0_g1~~TRINITY_DN20608_c0_g1_i1.p1  ORF type:complete len:190 (-),score=53.69 TRINITY_DN20608_c0_g1_i1:42-611(-)
MRVLLTTQQDKITQVRYTGRRRFVEFSCLGYWSIVLSVSVGSLAVKSFVGAISGLAIAELFLQIANSTIGCKADDVEILSSILKVAGPDDKGYSNGVLYRLDTCKGNVFSCSSRELAYMDGFEDVEGPLHEWMKRLRRCMKKEGKEEEVEGRIAACQIHTVFVSDKRIVIDCVKGKAYSIGDDQALEDP